MSIWIDKNSRVLVQGMTGKYGQYHTRMMLEYGSNIVAGVTPGKGGEEMLGVPVFDRVEEAVAQTGANVSIILVPARFAESAIFEAALAEVPLVVCITEHIPIQDMLRIMAYLKDRPVRLLGPNCPGLITPGQCKVGIMPGPVHIPGPVGVVSRSGTLTYEVAKSLTNANCGQSTVVGIGGDPIHGTNFIDVLSAFEEDPETKLTVMLGEIGGDNEEKAGAWLKANSSKPAIAFIAGQTAPAGKRMGHAGAVIRGGKGTAASKIEALRDCGVQVVRKITDIGPLAAKILGQ